MTLVDTNCFGLHIQPGMYAHSSATCIGVTQHSDHCCSSNHCEQLTPRNPSHKQNRDDYTKENCRAAIISLEYAQTNSDSEYRQHRIQNSLPDCNRAMASRQEVRTKKHCHNLHELRWLKLKLSDIEPCLSSVGDLTSSDNKHVGKEYNNRYRKEQYSVSLPHVIGQDDCKVHSNST